jgi:hypothetical protein
MDDTVGVLTLRIWQSELGNTQARITARLDAADPSPPEVTYYSSPEGIDVAVAAWVRRYTASVTPNEQTS